MCYSGDALNYNAVIIIFVVSACTIPVPRFAGRLVEYKFATDYTPARLRHSGGDEHRCVSVSMTQINAVIIKFVDSTCTELHRFTRMCFSVDNTNYNAVIIIFVVAIVQNGIDEHRYLAI